MSELGSKLKERRISLGLTIEEVEEQTKIRSYYIDALEKEKFSVLPGKVYTIGFLKSYSRLLGLDTDEIIGEFSKVWKDSSPSSKNEVTYSPISRRQPKIVFNYNKLLRFIIIIAAITLLFGINKFWNTPVQPPPPNGEITINDPNQEIQEPLPPVEEEEEEQTPEPEYTGVNLEIIPARGDCWIEVSINTRVVFAQLLRQGETPLYFADDNAIEILFGNAGAVDVVLNGIMLDPLGTSGEVVRKEFLAN